MTAMRLMLSRTLACAALALAGNLTAAPALADGAADAAASQPGVWIENKYSFTHLGFTSTYSCDGLADKLKLLLRAAGARDDVKAFGVGCPLGRPSKLARADLTFYTLKPAADAPPPAPGAAAAVPVAGVWKPVLFQAKSPRELGEGDCELVEQFRNVLLPMFTTRGVEARFSCVPHQVSLGSARLQFEAFSALPAKPAPAAAAARS